MSYYTPTSTNGHHSTTATFFCPQGGRCGEVQLYQALTTPIPILLHFQTMFFFKCYGEMLAKCWRNAGAMLVKLTIVNMPDDYAEMYS